MATRKKPSTRGTQPDKVLTPQQVMTRVPETEKVETLNTLVNAEGTKRVNTYLKARKDLLEFKKKFPLAIAMMADEITSVL